jgi:phenylacetate-CoA ligase
MERISGRTDDMLIIRGVNVFPSQIETVLMAVEGVEPHYQLIVTRDGTLDVLEVQVEINESIFTDQIKGLERLARRWRRISDLLGVSCKVRLVEPKTIQRSEGEAWIDKRRCERATGECVTNRDIVQHEAGTGATVPGRTHGTDTRHG